MLEQIKEDILNILNESIKAIKENNIIKLRDLSNQAIHNASVFQDENAITITVVTYSLSKIFERTSYKEYKDWSIFYEATLNSLQEAQENLTNNNIPKYELSIKKILNIIDKLSSNLKKYVKEVIEQAQIAKGSRLYEHGISIGKTASLLGISKWELMDYAGKTGIYDMEETISISMEDRIKFTREIFKK